MKDRIAETVKEHLRYLVDSFAGVLSFDIDPVLSEEENIQRIVHQTALVCAVVAVVNPVPLLDFALLTPIHAKMALHIGKVKGFSLNEDRALEVYREVVKAIGMSLLGTGLASLTKLVPILGLLVFVPVIYGATWGIGEAVAAYFDGLRSGNIPTAETLKELFKRELSKGKARGASIRREDIDKAYRELKEKIEQREKVKADAKAGRESARAARAPHDGSDRERDEPRAPEPSREPSREPPRDRDRDRDSDRDRDAHHTPPRVTIRERPVRKPQKTIGEDADEGSSERVPEPAPEKPKHHVSEKTIGPETPARGIEPSPLLAETVARAAPPAAPPVPVASAPAPGTPVASAPAATAPAATAPVASAPAAAKPNLVDELERLAKLRDLGALTPEEFDLAKKKLLSS